MKTCVYTRMFNDEQYIDYFIDHYLKLGFDKIIILNPSDNNYINKNIQVDIHKVNNEGDKLMTKYMNLLQEYDWVLVVDADEFLVLHKKYKSIKDYINSKLKINPTINLLQFRWAMIEKLDNEVCNFKDIVTNYKSYCSHFHKTMSKVSDIKGIHSHQPSMRINPTTLKENSDLLHMSSSIHNLTDKSYSESVVFHVHTRSVDDLVIKALTTAFKDKEFKSISSFQHELALNSFPEDSGVIIHGVSIDSFKEAIGQKAKLPFCHSANFSDKTAPICIQDFTIPNSDKYFEDKTYANKILKKILVTNNIDYNVYSIYIEKLIKEIQLKFNIKNSV